MIGEIAIGGFVIVLLLYLGTSELAERIQRKKEDNDD